MGTRSVTSSVALGAVALGAMALSAVVVTVTNDIPQWLITLDTAAVAGAIGNAIPRRPTGDVEPAAELPRHLRMDD